MNKLNLGCGAYAMPDYWNVDQEPTAPADAHYRFPPIDASDASVDEIYLGHCLEHFPPTEAAKLLDECHRVLVPGGRLGVVVPDTRWVLEQYLERRGTQVEIPQGVFWELDDLDAVNAIFLYSTFQDSEHRWSYDETTLRRTVQRAGFRVTGEIDRWTDPRASAHNAWSLGFDAVKPA